MAKSLLVTGTGTTLVVNPSTTSYFVCANAALVTETTEAYTQLTYHNAALDSGVAGTMSQLYVQVVSTTALETESTVRLRKNGANGNLLVTIPGESAGEFEDATNTDTINDGDEVNYRLDTGSTEGVGKFWFTLISATYAAVANTSLRHAANNFVDMSDGLAYYYNIADNANALSAGVEAHAGFDVNADGTWKNLFVYISSNLLVSGTTTVRFKKNGGNTLLVVSFGFGAVGIFEDTSHNISVVANDDVDYVFESQVGLAVVAELISVEEVTTNASFHTVFGNAGTGVSFSVSGNRFLPIGGGAGFANNDLDVATEMNLPATVSHFTLYVSANGVNSFPGAGPGSDFYVRKNGANATNYIQVPEGNTGQYEDSTHSDNFLATDEINLLGNRGGINGGITVTHFGALVLNTEPTAVTPPARHIFWG